MRTELIENISGSKIHTSKVRKYCSLLHVGRNPILFVGNSREGLNPLVIFPRLSAAAGKARESYPNFRAFCEKTSMRPKILIFIQGSR